MARGRLGRGARPGRHNWHGGRPTTRPISPHDRQARHHPLRRPAPASTGGTRSARAATRHGSTHGGDRQPVGRLGGALTTTYRRRTLSLRTAHAELVSIAIGQDNLWNIALAEVGAAPSAIS